MNLHDIPIILLEICSDRTSDRLCEHNRPRLLLQAACVVRLRNYNTKRHDNFVMAIYIDKSLHVSRYLLFERNDSCSDSDSSPKPVRCLSIKPACTLSSVDHRLNISSRSSIFKSLRKHLIFSFSFITLYLR